MLYIRLLITFIVLNKVLYNVFVQSLGLTITPNSIRTISDLDPSHLTDTRSTENASIGADTGTEYRIDAAQNPIYSMLYMTDSILCLQL